MADRKTFLTRIESAVDELGLKAHLARLELEDVGDDVRDRWDAFRDRLQRLREAGDDRWEALKDGVEASWRAFREAYRAARTHKR